MKRILVVGAGGQIGSELTTHLRKIYGDYNVVAADIRPIFTLKSDGPFEVLDVLESHKLAFLVHKYDIDAIFNLVALLSATGEKNPALAWKINMGALMNTLEVASIYGCSVFTPSSIGAFGDTTPKIMTPQDTLMRPNTMYGVCKVSGELMSDYYYHRFGIDTRSVRFPGIISNETLPGGGTTDYAVEVFYEAIKKGSFVCPIEKDTFMDMMYMPDALNACVELMEADPTKLIHRNSFNIASMSFSPEVLFNEIKKHIPDFSVTYQIDEVKQHIANSWPNSLDDSCANEEWGWKPQWNLENMTKDMLEVITKKQR
ncbi:MAG: NAD-dependent epimerase/dehydratase family protein [Rikenellaceae bacterium]